MRKQKLEARFGRRSKIHIQVTNHYLVSEVWHCLVEPTLDERASFQVAVPFDILPHFFERAVVKAMSEVRHLAEDRRWVDSSFAGSPWSESNATRRRFVNADSSTRRED
jgi:hypothetical protein